jgi:hypothetical protein
MLKGKAEVWNPWTFPKFILTDAVLIYFSFCIWLSSSAHPDYWPLTRDQRNLWHFSMERIWSSAWMNIAYPTLTFLEFGSDCRVFQCIIGETEGRRTRRRRVYRIGKGFLIHTYKYRSEFGLLEINQHCLVLNAFILYASNVLRKTLVERWDRDETNVFPHWIFNSQRNGSEKRFSLNLRKSLNLDYYLTFTYYPIH